MFQCAIVISALLAAPPIGRPVAPTQQEAAAVSALKGKVRGTIVWSSSRQGNHKIFAMDADGSDIRRLSGSNKTDWYPRISPNGRLVIFTRSKLDWQSETDANYPERWDTWVVGTDGKGERLLIPRSTWADWADGGKKIIFARGADVWLCNADGTNEQRLIDGSHELKGGIAQNPHLSDDGRLVAITLRGSQREVGVFNLSNHKWYASAEGGGCQMNFFPKSHRVYRVNPTGNGGTELFAYELNQDGSTPNSHHKEWVDLPGRRSHEYFPQVSRNGHWLVWCATDRGHDHDIADYEVYLWRIGTPISEATRLTFHSANDRWPDIHVE